MNLHRIGFDAEQVKQGDASAFHFGAQPARLLIF